MSRTLDPVYRGPVKVTYHDIAVRESPDISCGECGEKPAVEVLLKTGKRVGICDRCANSAWGDYVFLNVDPSQVTDIPEKEGRKQFLAARSGRKDR
jgi:hypothetical protein